MTFSGTIYVSLHSRETWFCSQTCRKSHTHCGVTASNVCLQICLLLCACFLKRHIMNTMKSEFHFFSKLFSGVLSAERRFVLYLKKTFAVTASYYTTLLINKALDAMQLKQTDKKQWLCCIVTTLIANRCLDIPVRDAQRRIEWCNYYAIIEFDRSHQFCETSSWEWHI